MTGNGEHTNYQNGDDWGMVYYCNTVTPTLLQLTQLCDECEVGAAIEAPFVHHRLWT